MKTHKQFSALSLINSCKRPSGPICLYPQSNDPNNAISVEQPNSLQWNLFMKTHFDYGLYNEVLLLYKQMKTLDVKNDSFTFPIVNKAVLSLKSDILLGEMIHCDAMKLGFRCDLYFCNTMIDVYSKYGFVCYARQVFDEMSTRDLVSWTSMISGYVLEGDVCGAFELFNRMRVEDEMEPNSVTLIAMLQGCFAYDSLIEGIQLHCYVIKNGLLIDRSLQNSILRMYSLAGCVKEVEYFFAEIDEKDVISWNTLMGFYSMRGDVEGAIGLFNQIRGVIDFSSETLTLVTSVLAKFGNIIEGEMLHCFSIKAGLCDDVLLASLLDFYAKRGRLRASVQLFGEISSKSSITWNTLISGYIQNGYFDEAIDLFRQMQASGVQLQAETFVSLLDACCLLGALQLGQEIHGYLTRNQFYTFEEDNIQLGTSILNMYIKCGNVYSARECFDRMLATDNITWTSMIEGYGIHGKAMEALQLFDQMLIERVTPNRVTFLSLLSACSHCGLIRQAYELFRSMKCTFGIEPDLDHYTCMVDLLGRHGKIKEALSMIMRMVIAADSRIWGALLAACRVHGDKKVGEFAAQKLMEMEPENVGYHTVLSNIQASIGKWNEVEEVRKLMHDKEFRKTPGWSYTEGGRNCCFVSGDRSHEQTDEIYKVLGHLCTKIQDGCL